MRYLTDIEIRTLVNLGKTIEMFLGRSEADDEVICWLDLCKGKESEIELRVHSVYDQGDTNNLDLYSFSYADPDEEFETIKFAALEDALSFIKDKFHLPEFRFLNRGMIQEEYRRMIETG
jgi:hypothetical protein